MSHLFQRFLPPSICRVGQLHHQLNRLYLTSLSQFPKPLKYLSRSTMNDPRMMSTYPSGSEKNDSDLNNYFILKSNDDLIPQVLKALNLSALDAQVVERLALTESQGYTAYYKDSVDSFIPPIHLITVNHILDPNKAKRDERIKGMIRSTERMVGGATILHLAAKNSLSVDYFRQFLSGNGNLDVNARDPKGHSALHYAAQYSDVDTLTFLVDHGADLKAKTNSNKSILYFAVQSSSTDNFNWLLEQDATVLDDQDRLFNAALKNPNVSLDIIRHLLDNGAKVKFSKMDRNYYDPDPPLILAIQSTSPDKKEIVTLLLERGADPNATDRNGRPALVGASETNQPDVVKQLLDHGARAVSLTKYRRPAFY